MNIGFYTKRFSSKLLHALKTLLSGFNKSLNANHSKTLIGTFITIFIGICFFATFYSDFENVNALQSSTYIGVVFITTAAVLFVFRIFHFIFMLYNYMRYKPVAAVEAKDLPSCTVIVPAYNEGKQVWDTLMSLNASNYPKHKLHS